MGLGNEIGLAFKITADSSQAYKTFADFEKEVTKAAKTVEKGFSDSSISNAAKKLDAELKKSLGSYEENLRDYKPKLQKLYKDILSGSFDQGDFERRLNIIPDGIREMLIDSENLGKGLKGLKDDTKGVSTAFEALSQGFGLSSKQSTVLGTALPVVGSILTATVGAITAAGAALFSLTEAASDYGSEIKDASDKTGLSAETLSALQVVADQSGSSLDEISKATKNFTLVIANAAKGSDEAKEKLKRLGIDPQEAIKDLDGSLVKALGRIVEIKNPIEQAAAASDAFGSKLGVELLPTIKSFDGDLPALITKLRALGLVIDDEAAQASDEFGDTLTELQKIVKGAAFSFARELMPAITDVMNETKKFVVDNKKEIKDWGEYTANVLRGLIGYWKDLKKAKADYQDNAQKYDQQNPPSQTGMPSAKSIAQMHQQSNLLDAVINTIAIPFNFLARKGEKVKAAEDAKKPIDYSRPQDKKNAPSSDYLDDSKEREQQEKNELQARLERLRNFLAEAKRLYDESITSLRNDLEENGDVQLFAEKANAAADTFYATAGKITPELDKLLREQTIKEKKGANERLAVFEKERQDRNQIGADIAKSIKENQKLVNETTEKGEKDRIKKVTESTKNELALKEEANKTLNARNEAWAAQGIISERKALEAKQQLQALYSQTNDKTDFKDPKNTAFQVEEIDSTGETVRKNIDVISGYLYAKKQALFEDLKNVQAGSDEEARINQELAKLKQEIETAYYAQKKELVEQDKKQSKEAADEQKKQFEDEQKSLEEILRLRYEVLQVEQDLARTRAEGQRADLERNLRTSTNKPRDLSKLRDFDLNESANQNARELSAIMDARGIELSKTNEIKNAEEKRQQIALINKKYDDEELISTEIFEQRKKEIKDQYNPDIEKETLRGTGGGFFGGLADALGQDVTTGIQTQAEYIKGVYQDLAQTAGAAVGQMIQGGAQLLNQWILTGKVTGQAVKQMVASVISGIASQAAIKAIFELAEGYAALANPITAPLAPWHFAAAKIYGLVAVAATGVGLAIGAAGGLGGGSSATSATATNSASATESANSSVDRDKPRIIELDRIQSQQEQNTRLTRMESTLNALATAKSKEVTIRHEVSLEDGLVGRKLSESLRNREQIHEDLSQFVYDRT